MVSTRSRSSIELIEHSVSPTSEAQPSENDSSAFDVAEASRSADAAVPDGGYGWVVVACCFVLTWWFVGTTYSWGVMQGALVEQKLASPSTLSFVGSLTVACVAIFALPNARIVKTLGARNSALLGVSFLGLGEICSGFTTKNVAGLFVSTGLIMGFGASLCFMVGSITPSQYFSRRRGLANGIVYSGGGVGGAAISFTLNQLIRRLGIAWTFRIIGFMTLSTGLPAAWFIRERVPIRKSSFVDWTLFRDLNFIVLFFSGVIATFPLFVPPFFLPIYCEALGLSTTAGAGLVAAFTFSSGLGRLCCGFMCDLIGPLNTLFASLFLSALSMLSIWPKATSLAPLAVFSIVNGTANGGFFATMPTVVGNVFGSARISVVMGMIVSGWAGGYLMGAPIAGYLLSAYGGLGGGLSAFRPAMYYAGSMGIGSTALVGFVRLRMQPKIWKKL